MPSSISYLRVSPSLVAQFQFQLIKSSLISNLQYESVIPASETKSHSSLIRLNKAINVRISSIQMKLILNIFKEDIIQFLKIWDLKVLNELSDNKLRREVKGNDIFTKELNKKGYIIKFQAKYETFTKLFEQFQIHDFIIIRQPSEIGVSSNSKNSYHQDEIRILREDDDDLQIPEEDDAIPEEEDIKPIQRFEYKKFKLLRGLRIQVLKVPN
ncbi:hypothetical protein WICMUC_005662 [Wickerhamomyces mucosus]|uniref:Uncharacterized protein n=1 Tax=Wickerhamomyces mucosus TaxID=1378264 RepID=A0A9P8T5K2_9ASCO|nr:hypothetical protein WICMUC_005662 [Wickerhamomyces mucosus]